jgi:hypothetical protein
VFRSDVDSSQGHSVTGRTLAGAVLGALLMLGSACGGGGPARRPPVIPPTATVTIQERPLAPGAYDRAQLFGYDYADVDHDGCDTREELLAAPGPCPPKAPANVSIVDPYTGRRVVGRTNIDVEHIVPLHWWWRHGAAERTKDERVRFANDYNSPDGVDNAILVSSAQNRAKGDRGPSEWMPPDRSRRCWYVTRWQAVLTKYHIALAPADPDAVALANTLHTC